MKQHVNDKGIAVPKKCQKCGSPVVVKLRGEPVYMCDKCDEYYGTVPCNVTESFMDEYGEKITLKTAKQIASRIHSKYKEDSKPPTGNQNCQLCTWCAEAQFRGIDVLPRPIYSPRDPALEIKGPTIVKSPTKVKIRNKDHIVSTVKDNPGSRYYIHVKWNGGSGGHEFLIINIDSNVYIMDAQQGLVESIDKTTYFDDVDYSGSYVARLDDKQLNRELLNKMNSMDTLVPWDWDKDVAYMKKHGMLGKDEDIRFIRYYVPSDKATEYLKKDPELKQYWETLNKETNGEILVDPNTKEQIGYGFVYKSGKNKGFIFNIEVMKKFRRQGFGTIILNDCVTKFGGVDLTVACDNEGAIKLYLKYGFEIVETVKGQNGRDEYYMKLKKSRDVQEYHTDLSDETFYRFEYDDEGIYEAFRKSVSFDEWKKFKQSDAAKWLPVPPNYQPGDESFFTKEGYDMFMKLTYPYMMKYLDESKIRKFECELNSNYIRYRDAYQVVYNKNDAVQEGYQKLSEELIPCKNYKHDLVYLGSPDKTFKKKDVYFVTPYIGTASIFAAHGAIDSKLHELGLHSYNSAYDEWNAPVSELEKPLSVVHVKIYSYENKSFEPFEMDASGYIFMIDISNIKDNIFVYPWMTKSREVLIANTQDINVVNVQKVDVKYIVEPSDVAPDAVQESFIMEAHAPKKLYFHVSPARYYDGQVFKPRVPEYIEPYDPNDKYFEDSTTPRVCFSTSIEGALNGITVNIQRTNPVTFDTMYVYIPEKPINEYKHKTNKELVKERRVYDANVTDEIWIMEPVRMKLYGVIHVDQCKRVKKKSTVAAANGARATRNQFTYKWHWVVKPKVLDKATEFRYDTMTVCNNLADELNHFKYGLIKDGKLDTKASDKDYDKYWKLATPEEFEQAGGGICYDFVEWEAGYLNTYGIRCNKFFASCMGQNDEYATHTFIVVKDNGKYIYIEKAFQRISDEIHNIKVFDKLDDIFDYVVETMVEYEHVPEFNYGIIEYTDDTPKAGTPMHEYQYWISKNGKLIKTGNMRANKKKKE